MIRELGLFGFEIGFVLALIGFELALNWVCFGFVFQNAHFRNTLFCQQLSSFDVPEIGFVLHN